MRRLALVLCGLVACTGGGDGETADDGGSTGATTGATTLGSATAGTGDDATGDDATADDTAGAPLSVDPGASFYVFVGEPTELDGSASTGVATYQWDPDDGSGASTPSASPTFAVTYDTPGRYQAVLTVRDAGGAMLSASVLVTVTEVPTHVPVQSSSIVPTADGEGVAVVSPDSDELVVVGPQAGGFAVLERFDTCARPRTVARIEGGWAVACQDDDTVALLGGRRGSVALPRGSRPYGIVAREGELWVTLQATGRLARIALSPAPTLVTQHVAVADARGVAVLPDGRLAVSRWRSRDAEAEVALVDPLAPPDAAPTLVPLQFDPKESSDTESGGIPSYLDAILVSPIGRDVALPSLQANIGEGEWVADKPLTFETTLRGVVSWLEIEGRAVTEDFARRKHFDNRGFMSAGVFSSRGDWLFVAGRGSRAVERVDMFTGGQAGTLLGVGYAPSGLAMSADDRYLFVDAFMSRQVTVFDVSDFSTLPQPVAEVPVPAREPLTPEVLRGKQLFNDSFDPRLAKDGYIACAHCHLDGEADRRTWDFTDRGEGMRNTISLLGRGGVEHGPIHWSANFDEVQDFEHDIRGPFAGSGLMDDADFESGTTNTTLGDPKAGLSAELDALAAYVESLDTYPRSPARTDDGSLSAEAAAGEVLFASPALGCTTCHLGPNLTDSAFVGPADPRLHDVGTITAASGQRLGGPLLGLDTPTLHELWNSPPYLHDGSAATLHDVLTTANPADAHGVTSTLTPTEVDALVAYLNSLEG